MKVYFFLFASILCAKAFGQRDEAVRLKAKHWDDSLQVAMDYLYTGEYEKSAAIGLLIYQKSEEPELKRYQAKSAYLLGEIYRLRKEGEKSVLYQGKAVELFRALGDTTSLRKAQHNLGLSLDLMGKPKMAIDTLLALLKYGTVIKPQDSARIYNNVGRICTLQEWDNEAERYLKKALDMRRQLNDTRGLAYSLNELATLYLYTGRQQEGIKLDLEAYDLILKDKVKDIYVHMDILSRLSELFESVDDPDNALIYLKKQRVLADSLSKQQRQEALIEMQTRYETAKKEKAIELLRVENELQARTRDTLIGGIIGLIIVSFLVIFGLRAKAKRDRAEKLLAQSKNDLLTKDLELKEQQLTNYVRQVRKKNELLEQLQSELTQKQEIEQLEEKEEVFEKLMKSIILTQEDWEEFKVIFEEVHRNFFTRLRSRQPDLTESEIRLAALTKLNLTAREMAGMLGISPESIKKARYRLRKKLSEKGENSLEELIEMT